MCPGGGGQVCLLEDQGQFGSDGDLPRGAPRHTWRASRGLPGGRGLLAGAHRVWDLTRTQWAISTPTPWPNMRTAGGAGQEAS